LPAPNTRGSRDVRRFVATIEEVGDLGIDHIGRSAIEAIVEQVRREEPKDVAIADRDVLDDVRDRPMRRRGAEQPLRIRRTRREEAPWPRQSVPALLWW